MMLQKALTSQLFRAKHPFSIATRLVSAHDFRLFSTRSQKQRDPIQDQYLEDENKLDDESVNCLMLHPISFPNHGAVIEMSLASEALGLVSSLDWTIEKGPTRSSLSSEGS